MRSPTRERAMGVSSHASHTTNDDDDDDDDDHNDVSVSETGGIGDRCLPTQERTTSFHLSFHNSKKKKKESQQNGDPQNSSVNPALPPQLTSTLASQEPRKGLPEWLEFAFCLVYLAVFGILGVQSRYVLQKLFGPEHAGVTSDQSILYPDLHSNMVGSFLMGWFGVVFKEDISHVSKHITMAITTGYLGSLTTFSGWNQKMLELSVSSHWVFTAHGFLFGMFLIAFSIIFGIETAKGFRWLLNRMNMTSGIGISKINNKGDSCRIQSAVMAMLLVILGTFWGVIVALAKAKFKHGGSAAMLWFACVVGPIGVWIRWLLARLNGRGLGRAGLFKWFPFGTLIANVSAACGVAALATLKKAVNTRSCDTMAGGIQFGVMGNLSTVSTFIAEFNAMRASNHPWRAYAYAIITICFSFSLGILIYCAPVWRKWV